HHQLTAASQHPVHEHAATAQTTDSQHAEVLKHACRQGVVAGAGDLHAPVHFSTTIVQRGTITMFIAAGMVAVSPVIPVPLPVMPIPARSIDLVSVAVAPRFRVTGEPRSSIILVANLWPGASGIVAPSRRGCQGNFQVVAEVVEVLDTDAEA